MTHVLTVQELQNKIPETKQLEGINFTDLKILITEIIRTVELSGTWEFVQYIVGKPSLFVVRQLPIKTSIPSDIYKFNFPEVENPSVEKGTQGIQGNQGTQDKPNNVIQEETKNVNTKTENTKLFTETHLPWK